MEKMEKLEAWSPRTDLTPGTRITVQFREVRGEGENVLRPTTVLWPHSTQASLDTEKIGYQCKDDGGFQTIHNARGLAPTTEEEYPYREWLDPTEGRWRYRWDPETYDLRSVRQVDALLVWLIDTEQWGLASHWCINDMLRPRSELPKGLKAAPSWFDRAKAGQVSEYAMEMRRKNPDGSPSWK